MKGKKPIATRILEGKDGKIYLNVYTTSGVYHIELKKGHKGG